MTALERTLDTLFGDMGDLLSEHQKPDDEFSSYNGDRIYEPAPFTDRGRVMLDLLHKFQLMYPGIIITDTEFITSGYAAFKFPNIGPYHDTALSHHPKYDQTDNAVCNSKLTAHRSHVHDK